MRRAAALLLVALAGCSETAVQRETRKLDMMKSARAKPTDLCRQMKAVTAAYLDAGDQDGYRFHKSLSDSQCLVVSIEGDGGDTMTAP